MNARFELTASDGARLACYAWPSSSGAAVVQIAHGMGEHAKRYARVGERLAEAGYTVVASDLRGHGQTGGLALGDLGHDGWNRVVTDQYELNRHIKQELAEGGARHILLGHSMGATLAQQYLYRHGATLDAVALSGSPGFASAPQHAASRLITAFERWRLGPTATSPLLQKMLFGNSNRAFDAPGATGCEWLSRDQDAVRRYVEDPLCGFVLRTGSLADFLAGARLGATPRALESTRKRLPILVFSGRDDPVHGGEANLRRLVTAYRDAGAAVDYRLYANGRHEMLNEINRDEVLDDLIAWLDKTRETDGDD